MLSIKKNEAVLLETPVFVNQYGEAPALFCGDFTGDGASDLMIWRDSGGNGYGYIYQHMYSFKDNNFEEISFQDIKDGKWFSFEVLNDNSARVFVDGLNQSALCALTEEQIELWMKMKSKEYETDRFGIFWDVGYFIPVDLNSDGKYELQCDIWFVAEYRSEIADLNTVVEYVDGRWIPISCEMVPFETQ